MFYPNSQPTKLKLRLQSKQKEIESKHSISAMSSSVATLTKPTTTTTRSSNVFEIGMYRTLVQSVESDNSIAPPKPLLIATPTEEGDFPVLLFFHGYLLYNTFYSQLIQHVASHGFIVIAPQLYTVAGPDSTDEINAGAAITNWLSEGLPTILPPKVHPNLTKLALSGHSRGGKTAFGLALRKTPSSSTHLTFSALLGIDPVDGMDKGKQTPPPILSYAPKSFDLDMAVMVIGSGLGEIRKNPLFPACAPKGVNHEDFFNECKAPACYFVAKGYGHSDMLDDDTKGLRGKATYCLCKNGSAREPMRRFVGGAMVAFLKAFLGNDDSDLVAIRDRIEVAPVEFQRVEFLV